MNSFKRLWKYIRPYRTKTFVSIFFSVLSTAMNALNPWIIGLAITSLGEFAMAKHRGVVGAHVDFSYIFWVIIGLVVVGIIQLSGEYLSQFLISDVVQKTMYDVREEISKKLNHLAVSYFDKQQQGEMLSRVTNDVDTVTGALQQGFLRVISSALSIVFTIIMMLTISPSLTLLILLVLGGTYFISRIIMKKSQPHFKALQDTLGEMNGFVQEHYTGFSILKLYNRQESSTVVFDEINDKLYEVGFWSNFVSSLINPLVGLVVNVTYILAMLLSSGQVLSGVMKIGEMQAFMQYIWLVNVPIGQVTQLSGTLQSAMASLTRVLDILDQKEQEPDKTPYPINLSEIKGDVRFENVAFGYHKKTLLMENIDFTVKRGQTVAIVGPTGAGKTTLINLLMRFYEVNRGAIKIDGIDIRDMTREQVRSIFGMVLQDPWLYHASISDNIRFGKLDASDYEIVDAAKSSNVHHFVRTLPEAYSTFINKESDNISQGQKQLLTIARVLVGEPKIIILDEATSSVDTRLELLIQEAMSKTMEGRTSFIIAHRLSTIRSADLILVMDHGSIVEQGTHHELLAQKGMYKQLYESQFAE